MRTRNDKGFLNGLLIGLLGACLALVVTRRIDFSIIVWVAMLINMSLGGFMGSFIPFTLKKFGLDPASGSSILQPAAPTPADSSYSWGSARCSYFEDFAACELIAAEKYPRRTPHFPKPPHLSAL